MTLAWLAIAALAAAAAVVVGMPAWRSRADRLAGDENAARYRAWRGRAGEGGRPVPSVTAAERPRLLAAGALLVVAVGALIGVFVTG